MLWQSQLLPWPPRRSRRRSRMRARTRRKPYMGMPADSTPEGERGREEERNARREGRSSIASVREQASKRAMGGRRSKIPNSRYSVGGYVGAQITIKRLHVAWDAHPVAVMPAVHSIIRHVSPLDAFVDVPSQFQRAGGRRLIILFCRPPFPLSERFCCPCRKASIRSGDENGTKTAV